MTTDTANLAYSEFTPNNGTNVIGSSVFAGRVVIQPSLEWFDSILKEIEEFQKLKPGWDGYNAGPIPLVTAHFALNLIKSSCPVGTPKPFATPGPNSDIQFEWFFGNTEIEVHVRGPNNISVLRVQGDEEEEMQLTNNFTILGQWLSEALMESRNLAATSYG